MSVFNEMYASAYDELYRHKDYDAECNLIVELISREDLKVDSILDIGCGTGGHLLHLAQRGYNLSGVDPSHSMLDIAKRKLIDNGCVESVDLINANAAQFECSKKHDFGIMMFAVIGYHTTNADVIACLINIKKNLQPGATLMFDFWYGPAVLHDEPTDRVKVIDSGDEKIIRITNTVMDSFCHSAEVNFETIKIVNKTVVSSEKETHNLRYFFPQEIAMFLEIAGFELQSMSAFPSLDASLSKDSWNALCVARVKA